MEIAGNHKVQMRKTLIESVFANVMTAFNELKWGRDPNEDDHRFAFRCMQQAHRLLQR